MTPLCGRDAESVTLGDRLAQQVDQRSVDASVCDTPGSEKKFHDGAPCSWNEAQRPLQLELYDNQRFQQKKEKILFLLRNSFFVMSAPVRLCLPVLAFRARAARCDLPSKSGETACGVCRGTRRARREAAVPEGNWWAGRDNTILTELTSSHTNCLPAPRSPVPAARCRRAGAKRPCRTSSRWISGGTGENAPAKRPTTCPDAPRGSGALSR